MSAKESRADWVAVEPQFQVNGANSQQPTKARSAFQWFQKHKMNEVKQELMALAAERNESFEVGSISKEMSARWQQLSAVDREEFVAMAATDRARFEEESRVRDAQVEEERQRKREEASNVDGKRARKRVRPILAFGFHYLHGLIYVCVWLMDRSKKWWKR